MLYQKVRPKNLDGVIGNQSTIFALKLMLREPTEKRSHAMMLTGPSGCGKTTLALILANEFGSDENSTVVLNAANTRGIDTVREISNDANFRGFGGSAKTFIFDESHQLTSAAQEALLKVIEDNPPHAYFIFCTTEPEKIIKTVRNRCCQYRVDSLSRDEITQLLRSVRDTEKLMFDDDLIEAICYTCEGSPRAALVSLEQVLGLPVEQALDILVSGTPQDPKVLDLCKLLMMAPQIRKKRWKEIITSFKGITEDSEIVRRSVMTFIFNRIDQCEKVEDAEDMARILDIFSNSTFYGGRPQMGALVTKACLL